MLQQVHVSEKKSKEHKTPQSHCSDHCFSDLSSHHSPIRQPPPVTLPPFCSSNIPDMPRPQGLCTFCSLFLLYSFCQYLWVLLPHMFLPFYFFPLKVFPMKPTQSLHIQSHITCTSGTPPSLFHILFIFSCNSLSFYVSFYKDNNCLLYLLLCPLYLEQCWSHI